LVYQGKYRLTDAIDALGIDAGKMVLSPTRTYAPVVKEILKAFRPSIHGMVHCSGGAQTKVMNFVENLHVVKDNLFPVPELFRIIQETSKTPWSEMYKVFNMGHRFEIYVDPSFAQSIIDISHDFGIEAKVIGHCESSPKGNQLTIKGEKGTYYY